MTVGHLGSYEEPKQSAVLIMWSAESRGGQHQLLVSTHKLPMVSIYESNGSSLPAPEMPWRVPIFSLSLCQSYSVSFVAYVHFCGKIQLTVYKFMTMGDPVINPLLVKTTIL